MDHPSSPRHAHGGTKLPNGAVRHKGAIIATFGLPYAHDVVVSQQAGLHEQGWRWG